MMVMVCMYVYIMVCFVFFLENTHNTHSKTVRHTVWIDDELKLNIISSCVINSSIINKIRN
jgi:hypothetical protein